MILAADTPDEQALALAGRPGADPRLLAALAADESRLARVPAIAAAIYANPAAPLSVANLAVATCGKVGVVPEGIPAFEELARAIAADPTALDAAGIDVAFAELVNGAPESDPEAAEPPPGVEAAATSTATKADPAAGPAPSGGSGVPGPPAGFSGKRAGRRSATIDFTRLKLYEKIRLATLGNAYCRQNLLRDANRMVAMAVIRSPQITDGEIVKAAGNRALSEEVIRYIGNRKELVKHYAVKLALVGNPKCSLAVALRLLTMLQADDVKQIARSKNVPGALSVAAKRLAAARGPQ